MPKTPSRKPRPRPREEREPRVPASDADRMARGLPLESGEPQPAATTRPLH